MGAAAPLSLPEVPNARGLGSLGLSPYADTTQARKAAANTHLTEGLPLDSEATHCDGVLAHETRACTGAISVGCMASMDAMGGRRTGVGECVRCALFRWV